jgi:hypothetical protein
VWDCSIGRDSTIEITVREARTLNQPSPLIAYTNVERELSLINLSLRQQLVGFDNCFRLEVSSTPLSLPSP